MLPPLNLPTIAAITPPDVSVRIIDDRIEEIHYDEEVDLVGITCITETAGRAYDIADEFRKRGVKVILGGIHPTLMTDDALQHADSVFCGELFGMWNGVLQDFQRGRWEHYAYRHVVFQPRKMTVRQLIDGFIGLYRGISRLGFVSRKARQIYASQGVTPHATAMIAYNLFNRFDAGRKETALRRNQEEFALDGPPELCDVRSSTLSHIVPRP